MLAVNGAKPRENEIDNQGEKEVKSSFFKSLFVVVLAGTITAEALADDMENLLRESATRQRTANGMVYGKNVRAVFVGDFQGCRRIGLIDFTLRRVETYAVCADDVRRVNEVAPAFPEDGEADVVAREAVRQAWLYGESSRDWQGYRLISRRLGVPEGTGCVVVELTIVHDGLLVFNNAKRECNLS